MPPDLARLAYDLCLNHVAASLDVGGTAIERVLSQPTFGEPTAASEPNRRVIAVIGSGMSHVYHGLPLATPAATSILGRLGFSNGGPHVHLYQHQLERLLDAYRLDDDFETRLLACSTLAPRQTRQALCNLFDCPYVPSLGYEVLAHMLKHRFLDAIINFNFDELLDHAIRVELGPGDYYHVLSDGDCPPLPLEPDQRYARPLYLKPHGSISHPSSLRFTREEYVFIPEAMAGLIRSLFEGLPVTVWILGFGMRSVEFNKILDHANLAPSSWLIHMAKDPPEGWLDAPHGAEDTRRFLGVDGEDQMSSMLTELWDNARTCFKEPFQPRGIERHDSLHRIFSGMRTTAIASVRDGTAFDSAQYSRSRMYLELAIAIAKARGFVNLKELSQGRAGAAYRACRAEGHFRRSLYDCCRSLGLKMVSYSRFAMQLPADPTATPSEYVTCGLPAIDPLALRTIEHFPAESRETVLPELRSLLRTMYRGPEIEIVSSARVGSEDVFRKPRSIKTYTELSYATLELLDRSDWDVALAIAETGEWLLHDIVVDAITKKPGRRLALIVADRRVEADLLKSYSGIIPSPDGIQMLPWWAHNHHMTVLLRARPRPRPVAAIYFVRRLRSPRIAPMVLDRIDSLSLLNIFSAYWAKARGVRHVSDEEQREARNELAHLLLGRPAQG